MLLDFWYNFTHNLFMPLLLFFYLGFLVPLLRVPFEFPRALSQSLTLYLLLAIGWHGGEQLAALPAGSFGQAASFLAVGFATNGAIGVLAYALLRRLTPLRQVDAATVAGYYGSDSAGTFVTCAGVLGTAGLAYAAYMPVLLPVMEIPGCLVALYLVTRLRRRGLDGQGNMPGEPGHGSGDCPAAPGEGGANGHAHAPYAPGPPWVEDGHGGTAVAARPALAVGHRRAAEAEEDGPPPARAAALVHEVFLNPGLYLLLGGMVIGFLGRLQGPHVVAAGDTLFVSLFQGALCLFLLEMGMTASQRLRDLRRAGWRFIAFGLAAPNVFASLGMGVAHGYSWASGAPLDVGTYVLFAVLCGAASTIAMPAVQRLAIPEASPTLPLAAALGLTLTYNLTVGIPVYLEIARAITRAFPVA